MAARDDQLSLTVSAPMTASRGESALQALDPTAGSAAPTVENAGAIGVGATMHSDESGPVAWRDGFGSSGVRDGSGCRPHGTNTDNPLSIVFLVKRFWPDVGGVEKYIFELARAVCELGHSVDVVAGDPTAARARFEVREGIRVHRFASRRSAWRAWWQLRHVVPLLRRADVVNISDLEMLEFYQRLLASRVGRRALVLTRHGMSAREPVTDIERERHARARAQVDAVLDDGEFIHRRYGVAPDCVPRPGLRPRADELIPQPEPSALSAVFIGRLEPDAGAGIYLDAVGALRDRLGLTLPLTVYGDGSLKEPLMRRARESNQNVAWRDAEPDAQRHLSDATVAFVSGRMAICEAMARRRLVAAAYVDPLKRDYVLGEWFSPYLLAAPTGVELADRLHPFLIDAERRGAWVDRAYHAVAELDWRRTAEHYIGVWRRCTNHGTSLNSKRGDLDARARRHQIAASCALPLG